METDDLFDKKSNFEDFDDSEEQVKVGKRNFKNIDVNSESQQMQNEKKRKRGPKIGFICNKINSELKKMLEDSDIPCEIKNDEVIIKPLSNTNLYVEDNKELAKEIKKSNSQSTEIVNIKNITSGPYNKTVNKLTDIYKKFLNPTEIKNKELLNNIHGILSLDDFKYSSNSHLYKDSFFQELNNIDDIKIEYKIDYINEIIPVDFNLISDFFKYSFSISLIINPVLLLTKIKQKIIIPSLLFAIYAGAYLFRPNFDIKKFNYYLDKAIYCLSITAHIENVQNMQAAYIVSNLVPGTVDSYIWSGFTIRALKVFNLYNNDDNNNNNNMNEYKDFYYTYINTNLLLNITCNCLPDIFSWLNQALPKSLIEQFILFEKHPLEKLSIKYYAITNYFVKVIKHVRDRRNGGFNNKEFKKLIEETENIVETIKQDYYFIQNNEFRSKLQIQFYFYVLFYMVKLMLFNMELSPYVYNGKLLPSKRYIKIKVTDTKIEAPFENIKNHNNDDNSNDNDNISDESNFNYENDSYYSSSYYDNNFKRRYNNYSLLEKIKYPGFNYKVFDEMKITQIVNNDDYDDTKFLNIPTPVSELNYENCYRICYETAEKATLILKKINKELAKPRIYYPYCLGIVFYHIGLFYMMVYANFKEENLMEKIEFYHEQIKHMNSYYPYISYYFSKTYEKAKKEAIIAFSDDSIIFCPRGLL